MSSDASTPLFSSDLISPEVLAQLPEGYSCRPIQRDDYHKGFLDVLRVLTTVGDVSEEVKTSHIQAILPKSIEANAPTIAMERTLHVDVRARRHILPALHHGRILGHRRHRRADRRAQIHSSIGSRRTH
jgi:hypothetical protein